jgi:uncharacterized membrane protein YraQ (UPF0718 family)
LTCSKHQGWHLTLAEFVGAPLMVVLLVLLFRMFLSQDLLEQAKKQADKGVSGRMEGHAEMDMSVTEGGSLWQRMTSDRGLTAISHYFVMDWAAVWLDIAGGLLIAGALAVWVPNTFWQSFFLTGHPVLATLWGPIVGPLVAVISFVCSVGNIPLAAVLWNGGISFGGVIAFIYADLLILPILNIYRKYYGTRMMLTLLGTFYAAMVAAGYLVELLFGSTHLIPKQHNATVMQASISWNYTTWLNIAFLVVAAILIARFVTTGGLPMVRMMGGSPDEGHDHHDHAHECH